MTDSSTGANILVAESDRQRSAELGSHLEGGGHRVTYAEQVSAVLSAQAEGPPDVFLVSSELEGGSIFELCSDLRASENEGAYSPIVLFSPECPGEETISAGILAGADDFVSFPARQTEFQARLTAQLRNKRRHDMLPTILDEARRFEREASVDPLTGMLNRRALMAFLTRGLGTHSMLAAVFVDLDHFKSVNDTYGHQAGDDVLKAAAGCLKQGTRPSDAAGRMGGEEFVVVLPGANESGAMIVAERLRAAVEALTFPSEGYPSKVTASLGVAIFDLAHPDASAEALLERADGALYAAKEGGRNRAIMARPAEGDTSPEPCERAVAVQNEATEGAPSEDSAPASSVPGSRPRVRSAPPLSKPGLPTPDASGTVTDVEATLISELESGRSALPALPAVVAEALQLANDPEASIPALVALVEKDPPIATRLVAMANSALFRRGVEVTDIQAAVGRLGIQRTRDLLIQVAYASTVATGFRYKKQISDSFQRSILSGVATRALCQALGENDTYAYMAGLIHNIGESRVYRILGGFKPPPKDLDLVADLVRRYHNVAGAELAKLWTLPEQIVDAVASHHDDPADVPRHVQLVMAANHLVDAALAPTETGGDDAPDPPVELAVGIAEKVIEQVQEAGSAVAA